MIMREDTVMITTREIRTSELEAVCGGIDRDLERMPRSRYTFKTLSRIEGSSGMIYNIMRFIQEAKRCGASPYDIKCNATIMHSFDRVNPTALKEFIDKWYESIPKYGTLPG
jgi:hypothetical protein